MTEVRHTGWYAVRVILQIPVEPDQTLNLLASELTIGN